MRKQFLLLSLFLFATVTTWAERIDVSTARKVAQQVATLQAGSGLRSADDLSVVYAATPGKQAALRSYTGEGDADYFVFNVGDDCGFVIVSGEDRVRPVLGYTDKGAFDPDNLPENMRAWLANYQEQITWAVDHLETASSAVAAEWSRYLSGTSLRAENGVLLETAAWNQRDPYNRLAPEIFGEHAVTGCVATAMGIIMKYHNYPQRAVNPPASNHYSVNGDYVELQIDYSADYDWDNMLLSYDNGFTEAQAQAVATLLYHCGANVEMSYGMLGSYSYTKLVASALTNVFGYSPSIRYLRKEAYRWGEWKSMIREELEARYPLIYDGQSPSGGHTFVCDGYQGDFFHINWGWGGYQNGYFTLSALDDDGDGLGYNESQSMILNIRSNPEGSKTVYLPYLAQVTYKVGDQEIIASIHFRYAGFENTRISLALGIVGATGQVLSVSHDVKIYHIEPYKTGWMNYSCSFDTFPLTTPLAEGQRVTVLCSADGIHWEPMRRMETVSPGVDRHGVMDIEADVPDKPEQLVNVRLWNNSFDRYYYLIAQASEKDPALSRNTKAISYKFSHVNEDLVLRYVITNFVEWKDKLAVYFGEHFSLAQENEGTKVAISDEGYFDIAVPMSRIKDGIYSHYLKVLSGQRGQLDYDIQVYSASVDNPVFESKGHKVIFVDETITKPNPSRLEGFVNDQIPFSIQWTDLDPMLEGKELQLILHISGIYPDQARLLRADLSEIPLKESTGRYFSSEPISIEHREQTAASFYLVGYVPKESDRSPFIYATLELDGKELPGTLYLSHILLKENPLQTEEVEAESVKVWTANGQAHIYLPQDSKVQVVTFGGRLYQDVELPAGETVMPLPQGAYIIRIGESSYKVVI